MEDLIACLYPFQRSYWAKEAIADTANRSRWVDAARQSLEPQGRQSRETTAPLQDDDDEEEDPQVDNAGLRLTFSHGPKAGLGFVLGTSTSCDIVLPQIYKNRQPLVSNRHCYIAFDEQHRLFVHDISTNGTIVEYDGKGREKRRNFKWIISGHEVPDEKEIIVVEIHDKLKFQIIVSKEHLFPDQFSDNINQFLDDIAANNNLPFGALGLHSAASTAAPSGSATPTQRPLLLKLKKLGQGSFGVVHHV
jgi:serine/threonine-protein kinase Chk2